MSVEYRNKVHSLTSVSICDLIEYIVTQHIFCMFFFFERATFENKMIRSSVCKKPLVNFSLSRSFYPSVSVEFAAEKNQVSLNVPSYRRCTCELENAVMSSGRTQQTESAKTT